MYNTSKASKNPRSMGALPPPKKIFMSQKKKKYIGEKNFVSQNLEIANIKHATF